MRMTCMAFRLSSVLAMTLKVLSLSAATSAQSTLPVRGSCKEWVCQLDCPCPPILFQKSYRAAQELSARSRMRFALSAQDGSCRTQASVTCVLLAKCPQGYTSALEDRHGWHVSPRDQANILFRRFAASDTPPESPAA